MLNSPQELPMNKHIERVILHTVHIPIEHEKVNCPAFASETLQRGPTGLMDGPWFGDQKLIIAQVQGSGMTGWGDLSRSIDMTVAATLASKLLGIRLDEVDANIDPINDARVIRGLHTAALDWAARLREIPLYAMFGQPVRDGIATAVWSGHRTPQGAARIAQAAAASGIECLKLKSSLRADDAAIARAVKEVVNDSFELVIDPNGRWENYEQAIPRAAALREAYKHAWLEDPLYAKNDDVARIARETEIPIIRTCIGSDAVKENMQALPSGFNLVGPWPAMLEASKEAHRHNLPFWGGSAADTGLYDLATIHFGTTQPGFTMAAELAGSQVREHNLLSRPIRIIHGVAMVEHGPGMGIDIDLDALEHYRVGDPVIVQ